MNIAARRFSRFNWGAFLGYTLAVYLLVLGIRLLQPSPLPESVTMVDGEHLLATHDAYNWLIRGIDPQTFGPTPFSAVTQFLVSVTGLTHETFAFWAPPVMASLVVIAVMGWAALLGCLELGAAAAVIAALSPGYLLRTLLGFYDTDLVMLVFPLLLALAPGWLLHGRIMTGGEALAAFRFRKRDGADASPQDGTESSVSPILLGVLFAAGVLGWQLQELHIFYVYLSKIFPIAGVLLVLFLGRKGQRMPLLYGLAVYALPMGGGWMGTILAILLLAALQMPEQRTGGILSHRFAGVVLVVLIVGVGLDAAFLQSVVMRVQMYLKPVDDASDAATKRLLVTLPSTLQSVIEAQNLGAAAMFQNFYPYIAVAVLGCIGFGVSLFFAPALFLLLPLLVLALLSVTLGGRMTLFAGPEIGLGLVYPLHLMLMRFWHPQYVRPVSKGIIAAALTVLLALPSWSTMGSLPVVPFISAHHIKALKAARPDMARDSMVWTWWDWGYATQYFTRQRTYSDGGRHSPVLLYPTAAVYASSSPRFANQLIKYIMNNGGNIYEAWAGKNAQEIESLLYELEHTDFGMTLPQKQYLVVTTDSLKLGGWITKYGAWNFSTKTMHGHNVTKLREIRLDARAGGVMEVNGSLKQPIPLESLDILSETGVEHKEFFRFNGIHLIIDTLSNTQFLVDKGMYNSLMVKLLLADPASEEIAPYFKLVYGNVHTRVFEVL